MTEPLPPIGSREHATEFRRRIVAALREEAARQQVFIRQHGPMGREHAIQALASAAIGVAYPELFADRDAEMAQLRRWHDEDTTALAEMRDTITRLRAGAAPAQSHPSTPKEIHMSYPQLLTPEEKLAEGKRELGIRDVVVLCGSMRFADAMAEAAVDPQAQR